MPLLGSSYMLDPPKLFIAITNMFETLHMYTILYKRINESWEMNSPVINPNFFLIIEKTKDFCS